MSRGGVKESSGYKNCFLIKIPLKIFLGWQREDLKPTPSNGCKMLLNNENAPTAVEQRVTRVTRGVGPKRGPRTP